MKLRRGGRQGGWNSGQAATEFALLVPLLVFVIFVAITFAVIGEAALAVRQLAFNGARYAAINPDLSESEIENYISSGAIGSPTITADNGSHLTVTVVPASGFGQPVTVTVAFDLTSSALVATMSGVFSALGFQQAFPATLTATQIVMSE